MSSRSLDQRSAPARARTEAFALVVLFVDFFTQRANLCLACWECALHPHGCGKGGRQATLTKYTPHCIHGERLIRPTGHKIAPGIVHFGQSLEWRHQPSRRARGRTWRRQRWEEIFSGQLPHFRLVPPPFGRRDSPVSPFDSSRTDRSRRNSICLFSERRSR